MEREKNDFFDVTKALAKGGLVLFVGSTLAKVAGFLRQFIIIRMLTPEQYGLIALGLAFMNVLAGLGNLGLYQGSQRFIAYHDAREEYGEVKGTIYTTLKIVSLSGAFIFLVLFLSSGSIAEFLSKPDFKVVLMIYCCMIPVHMLTSIMVSFFLGFRRADTAVTVNDFAFGFTSVLFIYLALLVKRSLYSPVVALGLSSLVVLLLALFFYRRIISPKLRGREPARVAGILLRFSLPLFFTGVSYIILNNTDTFMIGYFMPSDSVGFYNAAFLLMQLVPIFLTSLGVMFMPVITGMVARDAREGARNLYQAVTRWLFVLTLPLFLTFFMFPSQVLSLVFSTPYSTAATALAVLVGAEFFHTFLGPNEQALIAFGETKLLLVSWSAAAVSNIIMNYFFIPRWGISGAAIATGASLVILNFINSTFLYVKHGVHPFGRKYVVPVVLCAGAAALLYFPLRGLVNRSHWLVLVCYPLFLALGVVFTLVTRSVSEEDRMVYRALRTRVKAYIRR